MFICDQCGKRIEKAENGNALWGDGPKSSLLNDGQLYFTHKKCNSIFERTHPLPDKYAWGSQGLEVFMTYLQNNLPFDKKTATRRASFLESIIG
jgi:ribosomal protein L24E